MFTASGKTIRFAGFLRAYVEGTDDPAAELGDQEMVLPKVEVGDEVSADGQLALEALEPKGHETVPPARYTDASLVKRLEEDGIGRPSTYASIISTIERRGYVWRQGKALVPTFTAYAVTHLLKQHFGALVELGFTGQIEEDLDEISKGERERDDFLADFYYGGGGRDWPGLKHLVENEHADRLSRDRARHPSRQRRARRGADRSLRAVRADRGGLGGASTRRSPMTCRRPNSRWKRRSRWSRPGPRARTASAPIRSSGLPVYLMTGRFGPYVQLGETPEKGSKEKPRRASLTRDDGDGPVTLERALELLSLPRLVGHDAATGEDILANFGRFGPYVKRGDDFRSLASDTQVFDVTLDEAIELFSREKPSRRSAGRKVLRDLGPHPDSGAVVQLIEGRYGPYVSDGTTNASVPKDVEGDALTLDAAIGLLRAREGTKPAGRGRKAARAATGADDTGDQAQSAPARKRSA